tara:strand:- start:82 stop:252 length:171 start_codon:yes stop_codon:yes gene_type:complete
MIEWNGNVFGHYVVGVHFNLPMENCIGIGVKNNLQKDKKRLDSYMFFVLYLGINDK